VGTYEGEHVIWKGNPSWRSMLLFHVKWTVLSLIPAIAGILLDKQVVLLSLITLAGLIVTLLVGWIKRSTTRYLLTDRRIHTRSGLVSRTEHSTHVDRIQNVSVRQSIFQRMLGIGDVDWDTAGTDEAEADFTFRGVDDPSQLVRLADPHYGEPVRETAPPQQ
jgi:uncharacterized membrane protein YdbT with pleckstrin-like domain